MTPLVLRAARRPQGPETDASVHLLVSSRTWRMGLLAAHAFEYFTARRWKLFVHEDGSVDAKIRALIENSLPGVRFVPRTEANQVVAEKLRAHPACLRNREKHNLFLKFFDIPAFAPGNRFIVLDADLFFYRKPVEILEWLDNNHATCHYNEDTREVYAVPREMIESELHVNLWARFNSGLVLMRSEAISLDLSEKLLAAFEDRAWHPQFFEQTLYALNASAFGKGGPLPKTYEISWGILRHKDSICRHYVGPFKNDILQIEGPATLLWKMTLPNLFSSDRNRKSKIENRK